MKKASEIAKMKFEHYDLKAPWKDIIGKPEKNASILMFSGPGSGKSTVALQMADGFTPHGKVGYNAQEEGFSSTLQNKLERLNLVHSAINFFECENIAELKSHIVKEKLDFVVIDSFTMYDKRLVKFEEFRTWCKNQDCVLVAIVQTTKEGKFYGNADAAFNVDCVLEVTAGKPSTLATGKNRLGELYEHEIDLRKKPVKPVPEKDAKRENPIIPITQLEGTATKDDLPHNRADNYWNSETIKVDFPIKPWHTDPEKAKEHFKLKGIEFGNWLNAEDRVTYLANSMQALHNMATIIGVPDSAMGVNYQLGIAFGARGRGGKAIAHYESANRTMINLTKEKGGNSLAHEYGHCIDNLIGEKLGMGWISGYRSADKELIIKGNSAIIKTINAFYKTLFFKKGEKSSYYKRIVNGTEYEQRRNEILARCTDLYFVSQASEKDISTNYMGNDSFGRRNPTKKEFGQIIPILKRYYKEAFEVLLGKGIIENKSAKDTPKTTSFDLKYFENIANKSPDFDSFYAKVRSIKNVPSTVSAKFRKQFGANKTPEQAAKLFYEKYSTSSKKQLSFRLNGSKKALIYLGVVEKLTFDSDVVDIMEGAFMMFSNQAQNTLYIFPSSSVKKVNGVIEDATAEKLYKQWHNYSADGTDLEIDYPDKAKTLSVGTAKEIFYISDKIMQTGDSKGKKNYYKHDFDKGKRPVKVQGHMMIIEKIKWNERGILN